MGSPTAEEVKLAVLEASELDQPSKVLNVAVIQNNRRHAVVRVRLAPRIGARLARCGDMAEAGHHVAAGAAASIALHEERIVAPTSGCPGEVVSGRAQFELRWNQIDMYERTLTLPKKSKSKYKKKSWMLPLNAIAYGILQRRQASAIPRKDHFVFAEYHEGPEYLSIPAHWFPPMSRLPT